VSDPQCHLTAHDKRDAITQRCGNGIRDPDELCDPSIDGECCTEYCTPKDCFADSVQCYESMIAILGQ
jgi:hypothetical protein